MADPHWTSYVGMATGVVGAILGIISFKRSTEIKSLDLRIEAKKLMIELDESSKKASELLPYCNTSRERVLAATGKFGSGDMVLWKELYKNDTSALNTIKIAISNLPTRIDNKSPKELESLLVDIHDLQVRINSILEKYLKELEHDDVERESIRRQHEQLAYRN